MSAGQIASVASGPDFDGGGVSELRIADCGLRISGGFGAGTGFGTGFAATGEGAQQTFEIRAVFPLLAVLHGERLLFRERDARDAAVERGERAGLDPHAQARTVRADFPDHFRPDRVRV